MPHVWGMWEIHSVWTSFWMSICLAILVRNHTVAISVGQSSAASQHWENISSFPWLWGRSTVCTVMSHFLCICSFTTIWNFIRVHSNVKVVAGFSLHILFSPNTYRHTRRAAVARIVVHNLLVCISLTLRLLMSYIYGTPILDVSRWHTMTHHSR